MREKRANCNQPLAVMSELLREKQGEGQVTQQQNGKNQANHGVDVNVQGGYLNFWHALT
jgi:hypothetical protein